MTRLLDLPGNKGKVFAIDAHRVTAVRPHRAQLYGRGELRDMSIVTLMDHTLIVCAWPVEQTVAAINDSRRTDAEVFAAGYRSGLHGFDSPDEIAAAWTDHLENR